MFSFIILVVFFTLLLDAQGVSIFDFAKWRAIHGVEYKTNDELTRRFEYLSQNAAKAEKINLSEPHAKFGLTIFSDRSPAELEKLLNRRGPPEMFDISKASKLIPANTTVLRSTLKSSFDWRSMGVVTAVKDQGGYVV